jgi:hypothetical protein
MANLRNGFLPKAFVADRIVVIADQGDPEAIPASSIYPHKPWTLDDFVFAMATLLQSGIAIHKAWFTASEMPGRPGSTWLLSSLEAWLVRPLSHQQHRAYAP